MEGNNVSMESENVSMERDFMDFEIICKCSYKNLLAASEVKLNVNEKNIYSHPIALV